MGKRSRHSQPPRRLPARTAPQRPPRAEPERHLLDQIAAGTLDPHLTAIADAVHARLHLLHTVHSAQALASLTIGDHVRINHTIKPRYLHGAHATVLDIDERHATIRLHQPTGRFNTEPLQIPPLTLERLSPAA